MRNMTTVEIPGTGALVTFDADAYALEPVYAHPEGVPYWKGVVIGLLGGMAGHGSYAHVGLASWERMNRHGYAWTFGEGRELGWFVGKVTRTEAAQFIGQVIATATAPTDERLKWHATTL